MCMHLKTVELWNYSKCPHNRTDHQLIFESGSDTENDTVNLLTSPQCYSIGKMCLFSLYKSKITMFFIKTIQKHIKLHILLFCTIVCLSLAPVASKSQEEIWFNILLGNHNHNNK